MKVRFINPSGRKNEADLSLEQIEILKKLTGYIMVSISKEPESILEAAVDPFTDDKPAVSSKLTIHKADDTIGCIACSA